MTSYKPLILGVQKMCRLVGVKNIASKGLSEAVVIMIVILIAVVVGFGLKGWYDTQMRKLPVTDLATAEWSAIYGNGRWIVTISVSNNLDRAIAVQQIRITLADGTVFSLSGSTATVTLISPTTTTVTVSITPSPQSTVATPIPLKSITNFIVVIPSPSPAPSIASVEVQVRDIATGAEQWIKAVGGASI